MDKEYYEWAKEEWNKGDLSVTTEFILAFKIDELIEKITKVEVVE